MGEQATMTATRKPKTRLKRVHLCDGKGCRHDAAYVVITCYPGTDKKATYRRYCATHVPREEGDMMAGPTWYYICNACGSIVTIEAVQIPSTQAWECADCGSGDMTEFTDQHAAMGFSERIRENVYEAEMARIKAALKAHD